MSGIFPDSGVPPTDANNSLPDPDTVNCPAELWHSTSRCTPRFDPAAANAIISEIINVMECAGIPYDCSKLDNLCTGIKDLIQDSLKGCMPIFPDATGACTIEQLVLTTDAAGCKKLSRYSAASSALAKSDVGDWYGDVPQQQRPLNPQDPTTFYNGSELADAVRAGTVSPLKLENNALSKITFTVPCDNSRVDIYMYAGPVFNPAQAGAPNGARSQIVMRIDGVIGLHPSGTGITGATVPFTNFEAAFETTLNFGFSKGTHTIEFFVIASSASLPPVPVVLWHQTWSPGVESTSFRSTISIAVA